MSNKPGIIRGKFTYAVLIIVLLALLVVSVLIGITLGSTNISTKDVYGVILNLLFKDTNKDLASGVTHDIIIYMRMPRTILAIGVGISLSVCGAVMQAIVKNPLADPYILGVSSGASFGATLAIMLGIGSFFGSNFVGIMGCLGAFAVSLSVVAISNIGSRSNSVKLLLSGMAISSVCSAISSFIVYFANDKEGMMSISYWLMGSLGGARWQNIAIVIPISIICTLFFISQFRVLNLMLLGDEVAITLGTDLSKYRNRFLLVSSILVGFAVYSAGMIGFVGLIIPHVVRLLVGTNHKKLLPVCALCGALLLVWADILCRSIIPGKEMPVGIMISMIGAPCFIYLMVKKSYGFGGKE